MKRLLAIDDDQNFLHMLARVLARHDFSVATATTVEEALSHLEDSTPDFAVVDLKLEENSGLELIAPLRAANAAMQIVILTGYASIATTVEAIKRGADDYLAKPLDLHSLLAVLNGQHAPAPPSPPPMSLRRLEWEHVQRVLNEHDGNISAAARALGIHRRSLQRKLSQKAANR